MERKSEEREKKMEGLQSKGERHNYKSSDAHVPIPMSSRLALSLVALSLVPLLVLVLIPYPQNYFSRRIVTLLFRREGEGEER